MFLGKIYFYQCLLFALGLFSQMAFAEGFSPIPSVSPLISVEKCIDEGKTFGNKDDRSLSSLFAIDKECIDLVLFYASKDKHLAITSKNGQMRVLAYKNFIIIEEIKNTNMRQKIISGPMSKLTDIVSVIVSDDNKYISVLNQEVQNNSNTKPRKEILTFDSQIFGNVSPRKINKNSVLKDVDFISYSESNEKFLLAIAEDENFIASFNVNSDSRSPLENNKPILEKIVTGNKVRSPASIVEHDGAILVLSKEDGIKAFSPSESNVLWSLNLEEIGLNGTLEEMNLVESADGLSLRVVDSLKKEAFFSLNK